MEPDMPKKPHPADIANVSVVASAVRFDIALFLGTRRYATDSARTLDEARIKAARLAAENPNGRRPLIYAVDANGRSGLVTSNTAISGHLHCNRVRRRCLHIPLLRAKQTSLQLCKMSVFGGNADFSRNCD